MSTPMHDWVETEYPEIARQYVEQALVDLNKQLVDSNRMAAPGASPEWVHDEHGSRLTIMTVPAHTPHRINLEEAVELVVTGLLQDPDGREVEVERDGLLAIIYAWADEQATDKERSNPYAFDDLGDPELNKAAFDERPPVAPPLPPEVMSARTQCPMGRPYRDHARKCHPACDFQPAKTA